MTPTPVIAGLGTPEAAWRQWLEHGRPPPLDLAEVRGRRAVVLAAHPDDDVLAIGGLLCRLAAIGVSLSFVWATDGEASHPDSSVYTRNHLASLRRAEARAALGALGIQPREVHHLGLPDGGVSEREQVLAADLRHLVGGDDVVLSPWSGDGHPDHEAAGRAAEAVASWRHWQYPVWMWHWASPGDPRVPWDRGRSSRVPDVGRKTVALSMFATQIAPIGPDPADQAIVPPHVLRRFQRETELVFT